MKTRRASVFAGIAVTCFLISGVANGGAARPECHHFGVTPLYDNNRTKKKTRICLTSSEMISTLEWTKNNKHLLKRLFRMGR